ncbi:DUF2550 domain-containing protein [Acaricomes phytoseiuli]|uniref:DUF2550 domain-containing protein n=1 Tax=Acaricomes phytoseiuli TaxID=291968 RepID=UPI0003616DB7|nr:DUF2550 domain-containing protein [Acaricomes phytoseiuli]MCW1248730.1 DUF2550 domain-containing protein [Acaricomes phytoseiuli]
MDDFEIVFIVIVSTLLLAVLTVLGLFALRRFQLRSALGTIDASILYVGNRWRMGVCRYRDTQLEWFRLFSLSPRPEYAFRRSSLKMLGWRQPAEQERSLVQADHVIVSLSYEDREVLLAMRFDAYAGLNSWLEAGPVIGVGTWR